MRTKRSAVKPWTAEKANRLTSGVIRSLHVNVTKAAQQEAEPEPGRRK